VSLHDLIAFLADFNHGEDNFVFDEQRVEAEVGELFREIIWWWYGNATKVWNFLGGSFRRKSKIRGNHKLKLFFSQFHSLVHDNSIHSSSELKLHFEKNSSGLKTRSATEIFRSNSVMQNAVNLFSVEFRKLLLGHHIDEEVVADLRISVNALTMCLCNTLSENTRIFRIE